MTRLCYWDPAYIASQPFCISSKLTDQEAKELADFEELKFWERNETLKESLSFQEKKEIDAHFELDELLDSYFRTSSMPSKNFRIEKIVDETLKQINDEDEVGFYNIQPSDGVPSKSKQQSQQIRASFLTR